MGIISVSLPDVLLEQVDAFIDARGYAGRSEVVRAALRDFLTREAGSDGDERERSATLTLLYPEGYEKKIGEVRHEFTDIVQSLVHSHTEASCVEVFLLRGPSRRIRQFSDSLRALRETEMVSATYTDPPGKEPARAERHAHGRR